jgi:hypothetical protein
MKPFYTLIITYVNGSKDLMSFDQFSAVRDFYQHSISYSGGRVRRVEVHYLDSGVRNVWDISWNAVSKAAGLTS